MTAARPATARRRPGTALVAAAALIAGTLALVSAPAAHSQTDEPSGSAFGIYADVSFLGDPMLDIEPTPAVECPPDDDDEFLDLSEGSGGVGVEIDVLAVECTTEDGVLSASATVTGVEIELAQAGGLAAEVISAECSANGDPTGSSEIVEFQDFVTPNGAPIVVSGEPNQTIELGLITITFNRQSTIDNGDGTTSLTVDALVIELASSDLAVTPVGEIVVASVTCTSSLDDEEPPPVVPPVTEPPVTEPPVTEEPPPATGPQETARTGAAAPVPVRAQPTFTG